MEALLQELSTADEFIEGRLVGEFVPPGHYYSAVPSSAARRDLAKQLPRLRARLELPGIQLNEAATQAHLDRLRRAASQFPFPAEETAPWRYHFNNPAYAYADGISLYSTLHYLRPRQVIEVGSGYSSALMLDVNQHEFSQSMQLTFIEPHPQLLLSFLRTEDDATTTVHEASVQSLELRLFSELESGDILFIDSTHVAKMGSDVNFLFFEVLPRLKPGVWVHVHDIFWPFEYPPAWIKEGRAWNEAYLLRALLQQSQHWQIMYFSHHVHLTRRAWLEEHVPLAVAGGGAHVWLKVGER